jgi:hypothetical protein
MQRASSTMQDVTQTMRTSSSSSSKPTHDTQPTNQQSLGMSMGPSSSSHAVFSPHTPAGTPRHGGDTGATMGRVVDAMFGGPSAGADGHGYACEDEDDLDVDGRPNAARIHRASALHHGAAARATAEKGLHPAHMHMVSPWHDEEAGACSVVY